MSTRFNRVRLTRAEKKCFDEAKVKMQERAMNYEPFIKLDMPSSSSGFGGTSDTGNVARSFFSSDKRIDIVNLIDETSSLDAAVNKVKVANLLQRFSIILRILSS